MNKLEKAICGIINRENRWLSLIRNGETVGTLSIKHWKETKTEFMERHVETRREDDGTYSLWITVDGIESFFHVDSFMVEQW